MHTKYSMLGKYLKTTFSILLLIVAMAICGRVTIRSMANQDAKSDYAELNHIEYGIFNIEIWKDKLKKIVTAEINKFSFSSHGPVLKQQLEGQIRTLIDKVYKRLTDGEGEGAARGLKEALIRRFVDLEDVKKGAPEYAEAIIAELSRPQNEKAIKRMLKAQVNEYIEKTYKPEDLTERDLVLKKLGTEDLEEAKQSLRHTISDHETAIKKDIWTLIAIAIILFVLIGFSKEALSSTLFFILLLTLFTLLIVGVATPMIDMKAEISKLEFVLLEQPVSFTEQIMYFQSKSILDVFRIMIVHPELQMKFVGVLLVTFSILFPIIKLLCAYFYFYNFSNIKDSRFIEFFVFKSGKWSMTDVMVVAIFMAYIGFNGVLSSQLEKIASKAEDASILTTNGTSLQPGFYAFLTFAVLALVFSEILKRNRKYVTHSL